MGTQNGGEEYKNYMRLLLCWTPLPDPQKNFLLPGAPLNFSNLHNILQKVTYSLTACSMKSHVVLLTLDTLDSFDATIKDLLKTFREGKNKVILSSVRVLSNYANITITKW